MGNSWVKDSAFKKKELLEKDIAFKQKFYYSKGAHYETATIKTVRLVPTDSVCNALKDDYKAMSNMIYGEKPSYDELVSYISELEKEIHELA